MKSVLLFGATGLTGTALFNELLNDATVSSITVMGRSQPQLTHDKVTYINVEFNQLDTYQAHFAVDTVFCCLGTTIKKAKSKQAFKQIDIDLVTEIAVLSRKANAKNFCVVSALGADANSSVFYNRCKGEMEQQLITLFSDSKTRLVICRPSLLLGQRHESRLGESIAIRLFKWFGWLFNGPLLKYKPIHANALAHAMYRATKMNQQPLAILENKELHFINNA